MGTNHNADSFDAAMIIDLFDIDKSDSFNFSSVSGYVRQRKLTVG